MNLLLLRTGNSATEVLDTFTKTEILIQTLKKIKVLHMCNVAKILNSLFLQVFQILIIPLKFWRNLFSFAGGKCILLRTGNFRRKYRRGRIQYIKHLEEVKI